MEAEISLRSNKSSRRVDATVCICHPDTPQLVNVKMKCETYGQIMLHQMQTAVASHEPLMMYILFTKMPAEVVNGSLSRSIYPPDWINKDGLEAQA